MARPSSRSEEDREDTLSFASMVLQAKDGAKCSPTRLRSGDPDFEFHRTEEPSSSPSAAVLFSNGRLLPRPVPVCNPEVPTLESILSASGSRHSSSAASSRSSSRGSSRSGAGGSRSQGSVRQSDSGRGESRRGRFQPGPAEQAWQFFGSGRSAAPPPSAAGGDSLRGSAGRGSRRSSTGTAPLPSEGRRRTIGAAKQRQGLLGSIMSACKVCHAIEPSKQVQGSVIVA